MSAVVRGLQRVLDAAWSLGHRGGGIRAANELTPMPVEQLAEAMRAALGGSSSSGITVTAHDALRSPAFWTAVKVLSETIAQIPINVMRPTADGKGAEIARDAALQKLIAKRGRPNEWQTSFVFKRLLTWQVLTRGNFYALKNYAGDELREILPIVPANRVTPKLDAQFRLTYEVATEGGQKRVFTRARIFHVMGDTDDGVAGLNPINYMSEGIGLAISQDQHAGKLFANGARLWGVLQHPATLSSDASKKLREQFEEVYAGQQNAHKTAVLEEGMTFKETSQKAEEAQLLESRKLQRSIVASGVRVPAHMVGDLDKATFSNIENLARQYVDFGAMPWMENIETAMDQQLLSERERGEGLYCKFNPTALLRGDAKTRADFYSKMVAIRAMNPNEIRALEDLNPYDGGDEFINPNIQQTGSAEDDPAMDPAEARRARLSVVPHKD